MADDLFRTDPVFRVIEEERRDLVASMALKRREAAIDATIGAIGAAASYALTIVPFAPMFEILHVGWLPDTIGWALAAYGAWYAIEAAAYHHWLVRLS